MKPNFIQEHPPSNKPHWKLASAMGILFWVRTDGENVPMGDIEGLLAIDLAFPLTQARPPNGNRGSA